MLLLTTPFVRKYVEPLPHDSMRKHYRRTDLNRLQPISTAFILNLIDDILYHCH
nr:MAG TPA: hypothetical protein [Caudoviricetes sp.]